MSKSISPNWREILSAQSSITGQQEYLLSTNGALNINGTFSVTGGATSANQTNGSQKTQIVDAGGEQATVTGGKLDVNASFSATTSTTGTPSTASVTNSNTTVLALNTARLGATLYNESGAIAFIKLGSTASTTSYTLQMAIGSYYEVPYAYTGVIAGITSSGTAVVRVTELS